VARADELESPELGLWPRTLVKIILQKHGINRNKLTTSVQSLHGEKSIEGMEEVLETVSYLV
jgi:hypothetical protein